MQNQTGTQIFSSRNLEIIGGFLLIKEMGAQIHVLLFLELVILSALKTEKKNEFLIFNYIVFTYMIYLFIQL
jgi:hypothetical protein